MGHRESIRDGLPFASDDRLHGEAVTDEFTYCGLLPQELWPVWYEACAEDLYAVFSFWTPIAWRQDGAWVIPDVDYSPETRAHQAQLDLCDPVAWRPPATFNKHLLVR